MTLSPAKRKKTIAIVLLTLFIDLVGFSIIFPLYPAMLEYYFAKEDSGLLAGLLGWFGYDPEQGLTGGDLTTVLFGGFLGSLYAILQFAAAPFWGSLSDRFGRKRILLFTLTGTALAYLLWVFSHSFLLLLISRMLGGLMAGNLSVATAAVADLTPKSERSRGMALVGVAFGLGFMVGPAIGAFGSFWDPTVEGGLLANTPGINPFSGVALLAFGLSSFNLIWAICMLSETRSGSTEADGTARIPLLQRFFLLFLVPAGAQRTIHWCYFVFLLAFSGMEFSLTFLARERFAYEPSDMFWIFLWIGVILIFTQGFVVRRFIKRTGERRMLWTGIALTLLGFWLIAFDLGTTGFYAALSLATLGFGMASPSLTGLVSLYASGEEQGRSIGTFRSAGSLARALGPFALAFLYFQFGALTAFLLASAFVAASLILARKLPAPDHTDFTTN